MVATRWPAFKRATAICSAVVDLHEPPFSLPSTTTWAEPDCPWLVWTSMFDPLRHFRVTPVCGQVKYVIIMSLRGVTRRGCCLIWQGADVVQVRLAACHRP